MTKSKKKIQPSRARIMTLILPLLLFLALPVIYISYQFQSHAASSTCTKPAPTTAAGYATLLNIHTDQWSGADGGFSVPLPDGRVIWLFGDTFIGKATATGARAAGWYLVNNSALLQDKGCVTPLTGAVDSNGKKTSWIKPTTADGSYYWISHGIIENGYLRVFLMHNKSISGGWQYMGNDVATMNVSGTTPKFVGISSTPASKHTSDTQPSWGITALASGSYIYVYGAAKNPNYWAKELYVARVPYGQLTSASAWRFWNGSTWITDETKAQPVIDGSQGFSSGGTVHKRANGTYIAVSKDTDFIGKDMYDWTAPQPWGPWTKQASLMSPIPDPNQGPGAPASGKAYTYGAGLHPEIVLSSGKSLASYSVNTFNFQDNIDNAYLYGLRFVEVTQP